MPIKDPEKRRRANAERMRRRRAEGAAWIDPEKEAARKRRWYDEGGKEKIVAATRARRQRANEQGLADFARLVTGGRDFSTEAPDAGTVEEVSPARVVKSPVRKAARGVAKVAAPPVKDGSRISKAGPKAVTGVAVKAAGKTAAKTTVKAAARTVTSPAKGGSSVSKSVSNKKSGGSRASNS